MKVALIVAVLLVAMCYMVTAENEQIKQNFCKLFNEKTAELAKITKAMNDASMLEFSVKMFSQSPVSKKYKHVKRILSQKSADVANISKDKGILEIEQLALKLMCNPTEDDEHMSDEQVETDEQVTDEQVETDEPLYEEIVADDSEISTEQAQSTPMSINATPVKQIAATPVVTIKPGPVPALAVRTVGSNSAFLGADGYMYERCAMYFDRIKDSGVALNKIPSGKYWTKVGGLEFVVYCEMSINGGGWTLISTRGATPRKVLTAVTPNNNGDSLNDERMNAVRTFASNLMVVQSPTQFAVIPLGRMNGNCVSFNNEASVAKLYHQDDKCDMVGQDYCIIGNGRATPVYNLCPQSPFTTWTFTKKYLTIAEANIYLK